MSFLSRTWDLVTFRDLPANQPVRTGALERIETRSMSGTIPGWHSNRPSWPSDNVLVMTRDGYRKCVTAFACINVIADAVAEATLRVWEDQGSGKRDELVDHPLRQLMQRPHPSQSEQEFLTTTMRIAAITGYCVIEKIRSSRGNVVQLGHLRPDYVRPILRDQQLPNWEYTIPGEPPAILNAEDAIVYTYMGSPWLDVTGDTPLRTILREAGISNELTDFVKVLLERGAIPQIALVTDPVSGDAPIERLTDEEIEAVRETFVQKYAGYRNWTGPAVLDGMRIERVGLDLNQMAFKDLRDGVDLKVCQAFRIPPPVVQVMAGLTTSYGQTLEQSMTLLQMYTAEPLRSRLDGALSRQLLPDFDPRPNVSLEFDTSDVDALQEDEDKVHTRAREDFRTGGITLDEYRQRIGEEPLNTALGRSFFVPFNLIPTPSDQEPEPLPVVAGDARFEIRSGRRYATRAEMARRAAFDVAQKRRIAQLAKALQPKVERFMLDQRDRIVDAVLGRSEEFQRMQADHFFRDDAPVGTRFAAESVNWADEDDVLRQLYRAWLDLVGELAFDAGMNTIGTEIDWTVTNPKIQDMVDTLGLRVTGINNTTRELIETTTRNLLLKGTTIDEIADALKDTVNETYKNRAVAIARTESMFAFGTASSVAYEESGVVDQAILFDNPNHTTDPGSDGLTCSERNGLIVALSETGKHLSAEHVNGTLAIGPVLATPLGEA